MVSDIPKKDRTTISTCLVEWMTRSHHQFLKLCQIRMTYIFSEIYSFTRNYLTSHHIGDTELWQLLWRWLGLWGRIYLFEIRENVNALQGHCTRNNVSIWQFNVDLENKKYIYSPLPNRYAQLFVEKSYASSFEDSTTGYFAGSSGSVSSCFTLIDGEAVIARTVGNAITNALPKSPQLIANCFNAGTFHKSFSQ